MSNGNTKVKHSYGMLRANLQADYVDVEQVDSYVYLSQEANMRYNLQSEIAHRRAAEQIL